MKKRTPPVKMIVPWKDRCHLPTATRRGCPNEAWAIMTRVDGTTTQLCHNHARRIKDQVAAHPTRYQAVRFTLIHKL